MNTYDRVPIGSFELDNDEYLKPRSISSGTNSERNSFNGTSGFLGPAATIFAATNFDIIEKSKGVIQKEKQLFCNELEKEQQKRFEKQQNHSLEYDKQLNSNSQFLFCLFVYLYVLAYLLN